MRKFQKLSAVFLVAFVAFGLGCTKKASQDEVNQLKDQIALLDSIANVGKDGFIRGTFTGSLQNAPNTPVTYNFNYEFGESYAYNNDEDPDPEYIEVYRTDRVNYLYLGIEADLPNGAANALCDYIEFWFRTKLSNGQTFEYSIYNYNSGTTNKPTFSNVAYSNGRITGNFNWSIPQGHTLNGSGNTRAATISGSFDIPASTIVRRGDATQKGAEKSK